MTEEYYYKLKRNQTSTKVENDSELEDNHCEGIQAYRRSNNGAQYNEISEQILAVHQNNRSSWIMWIMCAYLTRFSQERQ